MSSLDQAALFAIFIGTVIALSLTFGFLLARWIYKLPKDAQNAALRRALKRAQRRTKEGPGAQSGARTSRAARRQTR